MQDTALPIMQKYVATLNPLSYNLPKSIWEKVVDYLAGSWNNENSEVSHNPIVNLGGSISYNSYDEDV
jgi:hypothetical protein